MVLRRYEMKVRNEFGQSNQILGPYISIFFMQFLLNPENSKLCPNLATSVSMTSSLRQEAFTTHYVRYTVV